jgi:hypothetical protein
LEAFANRTTSLVLLAYVNKCNEDFVKQQHFAKGVEFANAPGCVGCLTRRV